MGSSGVKQTIMLLDAGWSKELFQMLLFQIEEFVSWESLDGGPHIEFSRVFNKVGRVVTILSLDEILELYKLIDTYLHIDDVEIEIDNSNFTVSDTDKLETALVAILPEKYQVKKTPDGKMFPVVTKKITGKTAKTGIVWKKQKLANIAITNSARNSKTSIVYLNNDVKKLAINYLQTKLTLKIIQNGE